MSIFHPGYQQMINENYDPEEDVMSDEEIAEFVTEHEENTITEKCSECSAEIQVYVGRDSDALSWNDGIREPQTEEEKRLFEIDPMNLYWREDFIKPEYLICCDCKKAKPAEVEEILF